MIKHKNIEIIIKYMDKEKERLMKERDNLLEKLDQYLNDFKCGKIKIE
jgi:hypothetical protein